MAFDDRSYKMECDICGRVRMSNDIRQDYRGLMVCADTCWSPRPKSDSRKSFADDVAVPVSRPQKPFVFRDLCQPNSLAKVYQPRVRCPQPPIQYQPKRG